MKTISLRLLLSVAMACCAGTLQAQQPAAAPLILTSPGISDMGQIPPAYTCASGPAAKSPGFAWTGVPQAAVSLVLYVHDLNPRANKGVDDNLHWLVWNIPADSKGLPEGVKTDLAEVPGGGRQGLNGHNLVGYYPACPPVGAAPHHYVFELYALDTKLDLPDNAPRRDVLKAVDGHILADSILIAVYSRK